MNGIDLLSSGYTKLCVCAAVIAGFAAAPAAAAPITFNTALPVSEGEIIVREQVVFSQSSAPGIDIDAVTALTVGGYGITPRWSVFGVLPLTHIETDIDGVASDRFGLGDALIFSRFEAFAWDGQGATVRFAPLLGVRVPTGEDGNTGDGSVDVFGGLIATIATTDFNFGSQLVYTENRAADGVEAGDTLAFDTSLQYRAWPRRLSAETPGFLFGVLESNITWQGGTRFGGVPDPQTSGTGFSISPGLQYVTQRWIADLAVTIPVANSFDRTSVTPDYSVLTSLRVNF
ncbi:MAG: transporter [Pseudomonadota bacterium]